MLVTSILLYRKKYGDFVLIRNTTGQIWRDLLARVICLQDDSSASMPDDIIWVKMELLQYYWGIISISYWYSSMLEGPQAQSRLPDMEIVIVNMSKHNNAFIHNEYTTSIPIQLGLSPPGNDVRGKA